MKLDTTLTLSHLNIRREKAGDEDGPIAVDLKLTGDVRPEDIAGLFTTDAQFRRILGDRWDKDNDLTITDSTVIKLNVEGLGVTIELNAEISKTQLRWTEANVDRIVLETKPGRIVALKLRAQVHPTKDQVAQLSDWHSADLLVSLWSRQHDLDLRQPESAPASGDEGQPPAEAKGDQIPLEDSQRAAAEKPLFTPVDHPDAVVPGQRPPQRPKRHGAAASH